MKTKSIPIIFHVVIAALLLMGTPGLADDRDSSFSERDLKRIRKKVEALRAWKLTEELDLDEATSSRLFPAMREMDESRQRIEAENRRLVRRMAREVRENRFDRSWISEALNRLQENRMEMARIEQQHFRRVRSILSPEDTARYLLFQIRFQQEIRDRVRRSVRERRDTRDRYRFDDDDYDRSDDRGGSGEGHSGEGGGGGRGR
jgi:hypothetical protein